MQTVVWVFQKAFQISRSTYPVGMWNGCRFLRKVYERGSFFCQKWYVKGSGFGAQGEDSSYKTLLGDP